MPWVPIIANLVVLSGVSCFGYTFLQRRLQNYYHELFSSLEKCQKYHLDYLQSLSHLPLDKKVIIFGTAISNDKEQPIIDRSYLKKSSAEDRLWEYKFKSSFKMQTAAKEYLEVGPGEDENILAFNLPKGPGESQTHEQRIIHHREPICAFGQISRIGEKGRKITPQILMGTKHEKVMQYLDLQILKISRRGKLSAIFGSILIAFHFIYKIEAKRREEHVVFQEIEEEDEDLKEMII